MLDPSKLGQSTGTSFSRMHDQYTFFSSCGILMMLFEEVGVTSSCSQRYGLVPGGDHDRRTRSLVITLCLEEHVTTQCSSSATAWGLPSLRVSHGWI